MKSVFITVLILLGLLSGLPAMAQSITGNTTLCAGATTNLHDATTGGTWSSSNPTVATVDASTGVVSGLSAGTTTISYRYPNFVTPDIAVVTVSAISISATISNVACNGQNNGSIYANVTGGIDGYNLHWSNGVVWASNANLVAGAYSLTVTDAAGCSATGSYTVTQPVILSVNQTVTNVTCNGGNNGSITTTITGGTAPYAYQWSDGFSSANRPNQIAGNYYLSVTDANSCTANTGSFQISQPDALNLTYAKSSNGCNNQNNGSINTNVGGGTAPYTYKWSNGATTADLSNLSAGTYSVTVTDANGCTLTGSFTITNPTAITIAATVSNATCNGVANGSINTTVSGGTGGFYYSWNNGSVYAWPTLLAAGNYSVTVKDANYCTATASYTVTQPSILTVSTSVTNATNGISNGSITPTVAGGTAPYTYQWSDGSTLANRTNVPAGNYYLSVTDANGCTANTGSFSVLQNTVVSCTITGNSKALAGTTTTYTAPAGMASYNWAIRTPGTHVCDAQCHHNSAHICGSGCDHYHQSCTPACHHNSNHTCTNQHYGDHHCSIACHHNSGHICSSDCDHYFQPCSSACHHNSGHRCSHNHSSGTPTISGSSTGATLTIVNPCNASASTYTVTLTVNRNSADSCTSAMVVTVIPSTTITAYSSLYSTGSGYHPSTTKSAIPCTFKVFNRHTCGSRDAVQSHYSSVYNNTTGLIANTCISQPTIVNYGGGPAYQYNITVPACGHYLVIGKHNVPSGRNGENCTIYSGSKVGTHDNMDADDDDEEDDGPCTNAIARFHSVLQDNNGRCNEGVTQQQHGSLMLIVSPATLVFTDSVSLLPVIYESVEGSWDVSVSTAVPDGFISYPAGALSTSVSDSVMNTVQFSITDTGSDWTFTKLTHEIQHKGASRTAFTNHQMVNNRTNKPVEISVFPNPATDNISIVLPKFEGKANAYICNMLGQKVAEKKINSIGGTSVSMDVSVLPNGIYLVTVENSYGKVTSRMVKTGNR